MSSLKIYKASAGSGKTFTLAREFLLYLVKNPYLYKNILAVTFTNKATAEMKDRILSELFLLSSGEESDHLCYLISKTGIEEEKIRKNANIAFTSILHDFSNLSISTIDSFFQKIFRSFLYELGIKFNFDLLLNNTEVLETSVNQFLDNLEPDQPATEWLLQFILERIEDGKSYKIEEELVKTGKEIFKEQFVEYQEELFKKISDKVFLNSYKELLHNIIETSVSKLKKAGAEMLDEILKSGLSPLDFSYGNSGIGGYILKLSTLSPENLSKIFEPGPRIKNASTDSQSWTTKTAVKRNEITTLAEQSLMVKLNEVLAIISNEKVPVYSARLVLRNLFNLGLLSEIAKEAKKYIYNSGYFLLTEIPRFLAEVIGNDGAPFVYEKAGTRYTHYMIDEFQDTSQMQYKNFKPLVENSLSQGYGNLVVGDVKQSIYRWRNSDWQLLESQLEKDFSLFSPSIINLEENYRSKPNIISFNNALYSILPEFAGNMLSEGNKGKERIQKLYSESIQKQPSKNYCDNGYVCVQFFDSEEYKDEVSDCWLPETVLCWWKQGIRDIAVLVRENRDIPVVFNSINRYVKKLADEIPSDFRVVSGESLSLSSSGVINFLISLLKYSLNPDDLINQGVLLHEYQLYMSEDEQSSDEWFNSKDLDIKLKIPELSDKAFESALSLPLYEMVEHFISVFKLSRFKNEVPFILNFLDCVRDFSFGQLSNITTFLNWWDDNGSKQMISMNDELEAVKIVSIHKSKGMQYDAVIIPFPDWSMTPLKHPPILWCVAGNEPFNKLPVIPIVFNKEMEFSYFNNEYNEELLLTVIDNLNLLYVATTRARTVLEIACPVKEKENISHVNDLLDLGLHTSSKIMISNKEEDLCSYLDKENNNFILGNKDEIKIAGSNSDNGKNELLTKLNANLFNPNVLVADNSFGTTNYEQSEKVKYGLLLHEILASIKHIDDVDFVLNKFMVSNKFTAKETGNLRILLEEILNIPEVKPWFCKENRVLNERAIVSSKGEMRRPDRVVLMNDKVIVIDYKTGQLETEKHRIQVRNYVDLIKDMPHQDVEGWLLYTDLLKTEKVV